MTDSIYVLVEPKLKPGLKAAQVAHAVAGLVSCNPNKTREAVFNGRMIVLDGHPDSYGLRYDLESYTFCEPDLDGQATATAFLVPDDKRERFGRFSLAYGKRRWPWTW